MTALLPCPWCQTTKLHLDSFRVACDDAGEPMAATDWRVMHDEGQAPLCEAWGPEMPTREAATLAWNRRPPSAAVVGLVEALETAAAELDRWMAVDPAWWTALNSVKARSALAAYKKETGG